MSENVEEEILSASKIVGIPLIVRILACLVSAFFIILSAWLILGHAFEPTKYPSPKDLQLNTLIIFNLTLFFIAIIPLERMGIRIRKIGQIEFEQIINVQAREHAEELTEIRAQIDELQKGLSNVDGVGKMLFEMSSPEFRPLVLNFLTQFQPAAYSPVKIRNWGAQQPGFERLGTISLGNLRAILQSLLVEGKVMTRVSKLGNTLYKINSV
jgi:hypothetical protein